MAAAVEAVEAVGAALALGLRGADAYGYGLTADKNRVCKAFCHVAMGWVCVFVRLFRSSLRRSVEGVTFRVCMYIQCMKRR